MKHVFSVPYNHAFHKYGSSGWRRGVIRLGFDVVWGARPQDDPGRDRQCWLMCKDFICPGLPLATLSVSLIMIIFLVALMRRLFRRLVQ